MEALPHPLFRPTRVCSSQGVLCPELDHTGHGGTAWTGQNRLSSAQHGAGEGERGLPWHPRRQVLGPAKGIDSITS